MNTKQQHPGELSLDGCHIPSFDAVIKTWYRARHRYQIAPSERTQSDYEVATNELGLAFSEWSTQLPELVEQFRFWLQAHGASSELVLSGGFLPSLDVAIKRWSAARHRFQSQPDEQSLAECGEVTNILYLVFERAYENDLRTPDAFEEFRASLIRAEEDIARTTAMAE